MRTVAVFSETMRNPARAAPTRLGRPRKGGGLPDAEQIVAVAGASGYDAASATDSS
jgi:hypothetical protein